MTQKSAEAAQLASTHSVFHRLRTSFPKDALDRSARMLAKRTIKSGLNGERQTRNATKAMSHKILSLRGGSPDVTDKTETKVSSDARLGDILGVPIAHRNTVWVARVARFRDISKSGRGLVEEEKRIKVFLADLPKSTRCVSEIEIEMRNAERQWQRQAWELASLELRVNALRNATEVVDEIASANEILDDLRSRILALTSERLVCLERKRLSDDLAEVEDLLRKQPSLEHRALTAASGIEVTPDVLASAKQLLRC